MTLAVQVVVVVILSVAFTAGFAWLKAGSLSLGVTRRAIRLTLALSFLPVLTALAELGLKVGLAGSAPASLSSVGFGPVAAGFWAIRRRKDGESLSWAVISLNDRLADELEAIDLRSADDLADWLYSIGTPAKRVYDCIRAKIEVSRRLSDGARQVRLAEVDAVGRKDRTGAEERIRRLLRLAYRWEMGAAVRELSGASHWKVERKRRRKDEWLRRRKAVAAALRRP